MLKTVVSAAFGSQRIGLKRAGHVRGLTNLKQLFIVFGKEQFERDF